MLCAYDVRLSPLLLKKRQGLVCPPPPPRQHKRSALHCAAAVGHSGVVDLLLQHRADINDCDADECTALHHAASNGHKEVVEVLIHHGADLNHKNVEGRTALNYAAARRHNKVVELLLLAGASTDDKEKARRTPTKKPGLSKSTIEELQQGLNTPGGSTPNSGSLSRPDSMSQSGRLPPRRGDSWVSEGRGTSSGDSHQWVQRQDVETLLAAAEALLRQRGVGEHAETAQSVLELLSDDIGLLAKGAADLRKADEEVVLSRKLVRERKSALLEVQRSMHTNFDDAELLRARDGAVAAYLDSLSRLAKGYASKVQLCRKRTAQAKAVRTVVEMPPLDGPEGARPSRDQMGLGLDAAKAALASAVESVENRLLPAATETAHALSELKRCMEHQLAVSLQVGGQLRSALASVKASLLSTDGVPLLLAETTADDADMARMLMEDARAVEEEVRVRVRQQAATRRTLGIALQNRPGHEDLMDRITDYKAELEKAKRRRDADRVAEVEAKLRDLRTKVKEHRMELAKAMSTLRDPQLRDWYPELQALAASMLPEGESVASLTASLGGPFGGGDLSLSGGESLADINLESNQDIGGGMGGGGGAGGYRNLVDLQCTLSNFSDRRPLAQGSGARVLLASDTEGVLCVLKEVVLPGQGGGMAVGGSEVVPEHKLRTLSLEHPLLAPVRRLFFDSGLTYVQMPHYGRGSLRPWFEHRRDSMASSGYLSGIERQQVSVTMRQALHAVAFLHAHGVAHLHLKPENFLLEDSGRLALADFGFGSLALPHRFAGAAPGVGADASSSSSSSHHLGWPSTPTVSLVLRTVGSLYIAPELAESHLAPTGAAAAGSSSGDSSQPQRHDWRKAPFAVDVWALGAMLGELVAGVPLVWNTLTGRVEDQTGRPFPSAHLAAMVAAGAGARGRRRRGRGDVPTTIAVSPGGSAAAAAANIAGTSSPPGMTIVTSGPGLNNGQGGDAEGLLALAAGGLGDPWVDTLVGLVSVMMAHNPTSRPSVAEALSHPFFAVDPFDAELSGSGGTGGVTGASGGGQRALASATSGIPLSPRLGRRGSGAPAALLAAATAPGGGLSRENGAVLLRSNSSNAGGPGDGSSIVGGGIRPTLPLLEDRTRLVPAGIQNLWSHLRMVQQASLGSSMQGMPATATGGGPFAARPPPEILQLSGPLEGVELLRDVIAAFRRDRGLDLTVPLLVDNGAGVLVPFALLLARAAPYLASPELGMFEQGPAGALLPVQGPHVYTDVLEDYVAVGRILAKALMEGLRLPGVIFATAVYCFLVGDDHFEAKYRSSADADADTSSAGTSGTSSSGAAGGKANASHGVRGGSSNSGKSSRLVDDCLCLMAEVDEEAARQLQAVLALRHGEGKEVGVTASLVASCTAVSGSSMSSKGSGSGRSGSASVPLVANPAQVVTDATKGAIVSDAVQRRLVEVRRDALEAMKEGFQDALELDNAPDVLDSLRGPELAALLMYGNGYLDVDAAVRGFVFQDGRWEQQAPEKGHLERLLRSSPWPFLILLFCRTGFTFSGGPKLVSGSAPPGAGGRAASHALYSSRMRKAWQCAVVGGRDVPAPVTVPRFSSDGRQLYLPRCSSFPALVAAVLHALGLGDGGEKSVSYNAAPPAWQRHVEACAAALVGESRAGGVYQCLAGHLSFVIGAGALCERLSCVECGQLIAGDPLSA
eukprot:jgi/Mesvir1/17583/Mv08817-RA.2